jgi:hypothetical protein
MLLAGGKDGVPRLVFGGRTPPKRIPKNKTPKAIGDEAIGDGP